MNTGHFKSINIIRESIHLNSNPRCSTIFMEWFSAMFTIGNMSENTFCLYGFNTLHSTEKRNPIFHVSHCLTYFTYHNDLTETEEIKKRGQEYIEELYKNFFFFLSKRKHFIFIIQNIIQQHVVTLLITKVFLNAQKTDWWKIITELISQNHFQYISFEFPTSNSLKK